MPTAWGSLWNYGQEGAAHLTAFQDCLKQRQEVRKGWLLIPGIPDGRTHSGCTPFAVETVPPGKDLCSPVSLTLLLMERHV